MKKFTNATIYGYRDISEMLVDQGEIKQIGKKLPKTSEKAFHRIVE